MSKAAVVYWSGTGNTEAMAQAVESGARSVGADVAVFTAAEFTPQLLQEYESIAFGCPAMGAEELEETEFEPMFAECEAGLNGKKVALFGSYGWGDGEWMRAWEERCSSCGAVLAADSVICNAYPDEAAVEECEALGRALV